MSDEIQDTPDVFPVRVDECTPEGYLVVPEGAIPLDAIYSAINRAHATVTMLHTSIEAGINKHVLIEAVDSINGYLNQIEILMQNVTMREPVSEKGHKV